MQYHLDTIPVWEAMEQNTACPLCALYRRVEASEIERSLGGSVMEPDARIRVNEKGICAGTTGSSLPCKTGLGHALLVDSHTKELLKKLEGLEKRAASCEKRGLFGGGDGLEGVAARAGGHVPYMRHMRRYSEPHGALLLYLSASVENRRGIP